MTDGPLRRLLGLARRAAAAGPADDAQLLARFAATGDADAFELLVWRHGGMVLGVCRRVLGDDHAAEDAFQATFLALARQAKSVGRGGCVGGWLHRVARRVAVRARRATARRAWHERRAVAAGVFESSPPTADLRAVLDEELDRLPERFRRAVMLCYLEGASTAEAARRLGCPRGTVLSRLAAARAKLQARLVGRGVAPAILPAVIHGGLSETPAALVAPAVRTAVAGTAAPRVIELCDGVLRAMMLSKLKLTAAVVLTVGVIGGGAGWVALSPGGPGVVFAEPPAARGGGKAEVPPANVTQDDQRKIEVEKSRQAHNTLVEESWQKLRTAQEQLAHEEENWAKQRIEARLRLAEAEQRVKRLDRALSTDKTAAMEFVQKSIADIRSAMDMNKAKGEVHLVELNRQNLVEAEELLKRTQAKYEKWEAESHEARRDMVSAEEGLSLLDRRIAMMRRSAQVEVDDAQDRVSQLRWLTGQVNPADRNIKDLERKLDDVLRELTELRRELKK